MKPSGNHLKSAHLIEEISSYESARSTEVPVQKCIDF